MPKVSINLSEALSYCPTTLGIGPSVVSNCVNDYLSPSSSEKKIKINLNNGQSMEFLTHQEHDKIIITSVNCLSSNCKEGISTDNLPEILAKLKEQGIHFTALQFPHAFMVKGRFSGAAYRAHFNHIVIYKDSSDKLNAGIIDSAFNPLGVHNPIPVLGWLASNSILSGEELHQVKLTRLLRQSDATSSLQTLCNLPDTSTINIISPILTYKQPSIGDKRCGIYTLNSITEVINYIISNEQISTEGISKTVTAAHQALNEPEMMNISYPTGKELTK